MTLPRYERYKDSGVEWLVEVPEHWDIRRLKYNCEVFPSNVDKHAREDEPSVLLCNYTDVYYNDRITADLQFMAATASKDQIVRFALKSGDTIITKDSETADDIAIAAYVPHDLPGVICGYHLSMVRPRGATCGSFVKRLFDSSYAKSKFAVLANGLTRVGLGQYAVDNVEMPFPPLSEQINIATFLDHETSKIDDLIEEQKRLIELLKEKRQAVISNAVTKGLDPDVAMKDSGVEWLGEVPAHWDVVRVKAASTFLTSGPRGWSDHISEEGALFVQSGDLTEALGIDFYNAKRVVVADDAEAKRTLLKGGDVLVCITGAKTGKVAVCEQIDEPAFINQHVCLIRPMAGLRPSYLGAYLHSAAGQRYFELAQYGLKQGLSLENVKQAAVPVPLQKEQDQIVNFVNRLATEMDGLTSAAELSIALLHERRSALISAAVTGKIDVRSFATQ